MCFAGAKRSDFSIGDDRAMLADAQSRAFLSEFPEKARPDSDSVTPIAERHLEAAHPRRIRVKGWLSKV